MKEIVKKINEDAKYFSKKREDLEKVYASLMQEKKSINEEVNAINKDTDTTTFKDKMDVLNQKTKLYNGRYAKYQKEKDKVAKNLARSKNNIVTDLKNKQKLVQEYVKKHMKDIDQEALKKEEERLRNAERLIRVTREEFAKLDSEQQKIVVQAQTDYEQIKSRLNEARKTISYAKLIGDKKPEELLEEIKYAMEEVNNNFDIDNVGKLVSFKLDDKQVKKETEASKDEADKKDEKLGKEQKDVNQDEIIKNKIENNKKDIKKLENLINTKFKDDPDKIESFNRIIDDLIHRNKELAKELSSNKSKDGEHHKTDKKDEKRGEGETKSNKSETSKDANTSNEDILKKARDNQMKILQYMKILGEKKDDPVEYQKIVNEIERLQAENKKLYEQLDPNRTTDKKVNPLAEANEKNTKKKEVKPTVNREKIEKKEILGIEQKNFRRPAVMFDRKTGNYVFFDENGKGTEYSYFFYQRTDSLGDKAGKYYEFIEKDEKKNIIQRAISKGLTKRQAKNIDFNIFKILSAQDSKLLDNYLEALKGNENFDKGFDIMYDLRKRDRKIERNVGIRNIRNIAKKAKIHEKLGIAKVYKDKSRALLYGLLGGSFGLVAFSGAKLLNSGDAEKITPEGVLESNLMNNMKENTKFSNNKEEVKQEENYNDINEDKGNPQDFIKIAEGAMLFDDPTDELRIMNGQNANEKITIKGSSQDKMYKVTKTGYYSQSGEFVTIQEGQSLEEALKNKNLDMSFIEDANTIKMCHVVAEGIAQWVNAEDVEVVQVDKFGNRVEKTEEEKQVEEAYENYMNQYSRADQEQVQK